ncbi:MAG: Eco57I restriction-modification methylase domain-containing protein [Candidatus Hodarchaeales archaeon]
MSLENEIRTLNERELLMTIFFGRYLAQIKKINLSSVELTSYLYSNQMELNFLEKWIQFLDPNLNLLKCIDFYSSHQFLFVEYYNLLSKSSLINSIFNIEEDCVFLQSEDRYISKSMGRFYTPHKLITSLFYEIKEFSEFRGLSSIFDPTMGSGRFFAAFLDVWLSKKVIKGLLTRKELVDIVESHFYGTDLNTDVIRLAKLRIYIIDLFLAKFHNDWSLSNFKFNHWVSVDVILDLISFNDLEKPKIGFYKKKKLLLNTLPEKMAEILQNKGFSLIVANPPYFKVGKSKYKSHPLYSQVKSEKSHVLNMAAIFLQLGFHLVAKNGYLSFILPKGFSYNHSFERSRIESLNRLILSIVDCRKSFQNVLLEQVMFVLKCEKHNEDQDTKISSFDIKDQSLSLNGSIKQSFFRYHLNNKLTFYVDDIGINLLKSIVKKSIFLHDISKINGKKGKIKIFMGDSNNTRLKNDSKEKSLGMDNPIPIIWGKIIDRVEIRPKFIDNSQLTYLNQKKISKYFQKKVVIQRIIAHIKNHIKIVANYDELGCLTVNTITNITFESTETVNNSSWECISLKYIVLLLNSNLFNFIIHKFYFADAIRSMDLSASVLSKFLIPTLTLSQQEEIIELENESFEKQEERLYDYLHLSITERDYLFHYSIN